MTERGFKKFLCNNCSKEYSYPDIYRTWHCPQCNSRIKIKVEIGADFHTCYVLKASEIEVDMLVTLDNVNSHMVLAVEKVGSALRIALEKYTVIVKQPNDLIVTIDGGWFE